MLDFKGHRHEKAIILLRVRWYLAYLLSYRNMEEMMAERGVAVDHTSLYRWVLKFTPYWKHGLAGERSSWWFRVGGWTNIKSKGQWKYLYRAVDRAGQTVESHHRSEWSQYCCVDRAQCRHRH